MFCSNCGAKNEDTYKFCLQCGAPLDVDPAGMGYPDETQVLSEDDFRAVSGFGGAGSSMDTTVMLDDVIEQVNPNGSYDSVDVTEEPDNQAWSASYEPQDLYSGQSSYQNQTPPPSYGQSSSAAQDLNHYGNTQSGYGQSNGSGYSNGNGYNNGNGYGNGYAGGYASGPAQGNPAPAASSMNPKSNPAYQDDYSRKVGPDGKVHLKTGSAFLIFFLGYVPTLWVFLYFLVAATGTLISPVAGILVYMVLGLAYVIIVIVLACMGGKNPGRAAMCRGMILNFLARTVITCILSVIIYNVGMDSLETIIYEIERSLYGMY